MDCMKVTSRDFSLKGKQLRRRGLVPGSIYGGPLEEATAIQMEEAALNKLLTTVRVGSRVSVELDGKRIPAQLKEKSIIPLTGRVEHVSFQALQAGQKVNSVIHILLQNADKVTALLEQQLVEVPYSSLAQDMVDTVTVDVNGLPVGTVITVADIPELQSDKLELQVDPDTIVLRIFEKKTAAEEPAAESVTE